MIDAIKAQLRAACGRSAGLRKAGFVQGNVAGALKAALDIPIGQTVTDKENKHKSLRFIKMHPYA